MYNKKNFFWDNDFLHTFGEALHRATRCFLRYFFEKKGIIMSYKNSVKIFSSNFNWVYVQLLYNVICSAFVCLVSFLIAMPTINLLKAEGWFDAVARLVEAVYTTPRAINASFKEIILTFFNILSNNFSAYWLSYIGFCLSAIILPMYLNGLSRYVVCKMSNAKISSLTNLGFFSTLFSEFGRASSYSLLRLLIDLVFLMFEIVLFCLYLMFADGVFLTILLLIILLAFVLFLASLKLTVLANFAPVMIEENLPAGKALKRGATMSGRAFGRTLGNSVIVLLTLMVINVFFGVFTVGVGLFITIPSTGVFISLFMVTNFYTIEGKRYYLADNLIVEPKKENIEN